MIQAEPSEVAAAYLVQAGILTRVATSGAWPVTKGWLPEDQPDDRVAIFDPNASWIQRTQRSRVTDVKPSIQVRVRSNDYTVGRTLIETIKTAFDSCENNIVQAIINNSGGTQNIQIQLFTILSTPAWLCREEENRRDHFVMTAQMTLTEVD